MIQFLQDRICQIAAGVLLSLAGVATSWSGYQAALWSGVMATTYSKAAAIRLQSSLIAAEAGQQQMTDINIFMQWLDAYANNDTELEEFYRARFRPEFMSAFEAWIASKPRLNEGALPTPFAQPEYNLAKRKKSQELEKKSVETFKYGQQANHNSDNYVRTTVVFGLVLFFVGISQLFEDRWVRSALLSLAVIMIVMGFYCVLTYPTLSAFDRF